VKVTFLTPGYVWVPSGGIRVIYEYANRLAEKGHEVSVVHPRKLNKFSSTERRSTYQTVRNSIHRLRERIQKPSIDWQNINPRVRLLYVPSSDDKYIPDGDAIFATAWMTARSVLEYSKVKGEKFYLIQHYETWMGPKDLVDATWRSSLHKVVISKWLLQVGATLGCNDLAYIPNAVNQERYRLIHPIDGRQPCIAMAFSKTAFKGAQDGIEALAIVRKRYPDLRVVFFGATNVRPPIPHWIEYHSNPPQDFIVREIYNKSSIFLCPSWSEGFALPPAEAASCGCAVVATDNGGIRDYVESEVTGLLSTPRDVKALATNMLRLLEDDKLRITLARACSDAVAKLSWENSTSRLESLISEKSGLRQQESSLVGL